MIWTSATDRPPNIRTMTMKLKLQSKIWMLTGPAAVMRLAMTSMLMTRLQAKNRKKREVMIDTRTAQ
eukprot:1127851-Karenia_brevis.AAC.1